MKIILIGCTRSTRRFIFEILKRTDCEIIGIFTLKDELAYRKSRFTTLDDIAEKFKINLIKIDNINDPKNIALIKKLQPDLILESGWSQIISKEIINIPSKGCIGIHYSYLPKNQGAASLNWALIRNAKSWGVTMFYLTEKIDDGDIIDQKEFFIEISDDVNSLFRKADRLVAGMLRKNLPLIEKDKILGIKQNKVEASYLGKRNPKDGQINWKNSNLEIYNLVRALTRPYPGAFTFFRKRKILIWKATIQNRGQGKPGQIIKIVDGKGLVVGTGHGTILLESLQLDDSTPVRGDTFVKKHGLKVSEYFAENE